MVGRSGERRALERGDGECAQFSFAHLRQHVHDIAEEHRQAAGEYVRQHGGRAAIGHRRHVDVRHVFEQLAGEMLRGADAGMAVGELARLSTRQ